jgi:PAS domain S-box-containing protein
MEKLDISVLYVEDEQIIRDFIAKMLSRKVREFYLAYDGREGLEKYKQTKPDLVITDIRMPNMNGLEMLREIKAIDEDVKVIITSAYSESDYFLEAITLGVNHFLLKPVKKKKMFKLLEEFAESILMRKKLAKEETERKKAEEALQKSHKELNRVLSTVSDAVWSSEIDETGKWKYRHVSPAFQEITTRSLAFFSKEGHEWKEIIHPEDVDLWQREIEKILRGESKDYILEYRIMTQTGEIKWLQTRAVATKIGDGKYRIDGVFTDITESKYKEERINHLYNSLMQELELAGSVQSYLLPQWLKVEENIIFSSNYTPSETVGGDLFDIVKISKDRYIVYVGDIAGHGVQGALIMMAVKSTIKMLIENEKENVKPYFLINRLNNILSKEVFLKKYMTLLMCEVDLKANVIRFFNAGHPPLIRYKRKTGKAEKIPNKGSVPIGWIKEVNYSEKEQDELPLEDDMIYFLYTDGIFECENAVGKQLGIDGFIEFLETNVDHINTCILPHKIKKQMVDHNYNISADDFTLVALRKRQENEDANKKIFTVKSMLQNTRNIRIECEKYVMSKVNNPELGARIELIVDEFVNNIIIHGLYHKSDTLILVEIEVGEDIVMTFWDKGIRWKLPPKKSSAEYFDNDSLFDTSGRGIPIIYSMAKEVKRNRYDDINETVIITPRKLDLTAKNFK